MLSCVRLFAPPWTLACQAPSSMGFSNKNTGVGCHFLLQYVFPRCLKNIEFSLCYVKTNDKLLLCFFSAQVRSYIKKARMEGAQILCGEGVDKLNLPPRNQAGYFMLPTVITVVKDESCCMKEEIFGPVTCVVPFDSEEEVIQRANNVKYGLAATVWSGNVGRVHRVAKKLQSGLVWTNCWLIRELNLPFGGMKSSGVGREGAKDSYEFFTEVKTITVKH